MTQEQAIEELRSALQRCINVLVEHGHGDDSVTMDAVGVMEETR